jgi:branched-chain amino acid aminotransferase
LQNDAVSNFLIHNDRLRPTSENDLFEAINGQSIYEVIKIAQGVALFFEDHMARMRQSARLLALELDQPDGRILDQIARLVRENRSPEANAKLVWTRVDGQPVYLTYLIAREEPGPQAARRGIHTLLFEGRRDTPNIKTISGSFRERVKAARAREGAFEALLLDAQGFITEGSRSNLFFLQDGRLFTPPAEAVLMGVTRKQVIAICSEMGLPVQEKRLHRDALEHIQGAIITGTTVDVLPIGSVDSLQLPSASHPLLCDIIRRYDALAAAYIAGRKAA